MKQHDLRKIFGKFAGTEVAVTETVHTIKIAGKDYDIHEARLDDNQPVVTEMHKAAKDNGLSLRIWTPGMMGTMDFRNNRVNVNIAKGDDGKWRVGGSFNIG